MTTYGCYYTIYGCYLTTKSSIYRSSRNNQGQKMKLLVGFQMFIATKSRRHEGSQSGDAKKYEVDLDFH